MARLDEKDRKQVGNLAHECGQMAKVYQSKRTHLYIICPACGCDQSNDAATQSRWFEQLQPTGDGVFPVPRRVMTAAPKKPAQTSAVVTVHGTAVPENRTELVPDFAPIGTSTENGAQSPNDAAPKKPAQTSAVVTVHGTAVPENRTELAPEITPIGATGHGGFFWILMAGFAGMGIALKAIHTTTGAQSA